MWFKRMLIEKESPEQYGYDRIKYNLTESSTSDKSLADLGIKINDKLLLCYGDHLGKPQLRELIGQRYGVTANDVTITTGACMALFTIYSTLLKPDDHVIVIHPNYPANIEITRSLGCNVELYKLNFSEGFRFNAEKMIAMLKPETKLVNITYPHNPTGTMLSQQDLSLLAKACEANGTYLLVDETYGDLTWGPRLSHVCNLTPYGICVESLSKAIGAPGIRAGWIVTKNKKLQEDIIAVKEQICICGSVVDDECAYQILQRNDALMAPIRKDLEEKFSVVCEAMESQNVLEWVKPEGGVIFFPHIKDEIEIDTEKFYDVLNNKYGVFVGPGHWFDVDDRYFRVGYAWPDKEQLRGGLAGLVAAVKETGKNIN